MDARFAALALSLLLYGIFGSPTPNEPGYIELLIAVLLLFSIKPSAVISVLQGPISAERVSFAPLFLFGLVVPLLIGVVQTHPLPLVARDLAAFFFLCLPLFVWPDRQERQFLILAMTVAVLFAVRVLAEALGWMPPNHELLYLANSPLVIMTAIAGFCLAGQDVYERDIRYRTFICLGAGALCLLAMLVDVQRATISAVILSLGFCAAACFVKSPGRMIWPLLIVILFIAAGWEVIVATWQSMAIKTALVGVNARSAELAAVWAELSASPLRALFGIGWGGQFDSPAVGGWSVTYTHSLLSYMLLKTGLAGLGLTLAALSSCFLSLTRGFFHNTVMALAIGWAILIPVLFYASYKSLDFGLVLVLALLLPRAIASRPV